MDLLVQDFGTISFHDVVDFCDQKIVENTELDYKMVIPKDLAKHFAAMSNRYGGLIIVGVQEDSQTGLPVTYNGIAYNGKLIDQIHQIAGNVRPLPTYNVRMTDQVQGKVFLLVRINEGGAPPYTPINDPTVYLRTGNVTKPLGPADVETLRELYAKRDRAEAVRQSNVARADAVFLSLLEREDRKLLQPLLHEATAEGGLKFQLQAFDENFRMLTAYLQPFYPGRELALPREISAVLGDARVRTPQDNGWALPSFNMKPMARGLYDFRSMYDDDSFAADQMDASGFFMRSEHIGFSRGERAENIYLSDIARLLYATLLFGRKLYSRLGYSGVVRGAIRLTGASDRPVRFLSENEYNARDAEAISPSCIWPIEADTHKLGDDGWMRDNFRTTMREIYWDLGIEDVQNGTLDQFLGEWRFT
jgi:hypothetical protein